MPKPESLVDQLTEAAMNARQLLGEIRGATGDLRAAIREARAFLQDEIEGTIQGRVNETVDVQLALVGEAARSYMDASVDRINNSFDKIADILMGDNRDEMLALWQGTDVFHPSKRCRQCNTDLNAHYNAEGIKPRAGSFSICIECGCVAIFLSNGLLRQPSNEEMRVFRENEELQDVSAEAAVLRMRKDHGDSAGVYAELGTKQLAPMLAPPSHGHQRRDET
jgi:hypothetical protein